MATSMMLTKHGTHAADLPLSAIIHAAETDLKRMSAKARAKWSKRSTFLLERIGELYAFAPRHVRRAKDPVDLLLIAAQDTSPLLKTTLPNRVMLYSDPDRLVDAAELLLAGAAAREPEAA